MKKALFIVYNKKIMRKNQAIIGYLGVNNKIIVYD